MSPQACSRKLRIGLSVRCAFARLRHPGTGCGRRRCPQCRGSPRHEKNLPPIRFLVRWQCRERCPRTLWRGRVWMQAVRLFPQLWISGPYSPAPRRCLRSFPPMRVAILFRSAWAAALSIATPKPSCRRSKTRWGRLCMTSRFKKNHPSSYRNNFRWKLRAEWMFPKLPLRRCPRNCRGNRRNLRFKAEF